MTGTVTAYAGEYGVNACQIEPIMQLPEDADAAKAQWQAIEAGQEVARITCGRDTTNAGGSCVMSQGPPMDVWSEGLPCIGDTYGVKKWLECKW